MAKISSCASFVYLRPEKKFENIDALVQQIERDVQQARELAAV